MIIIRTSARQSDLVIIKKIKRTCQIVHFAVLADHRVKLKENEKRDKYLDLAREVKKRTMEHESAGDTNSNWCAQYSHQGIGDKRTSGDHPNYSVVEIGQNTKKSPGDLISRTGTQTPEENYQLTLARKTLKRIE